MPTLTLKPNGPTRPPFRAPWQRCVAVGRAYELLRADVLEHVAEAQAAIGWTHCRFHGLFHDDMNVVQRAPDGTLRFQWHHIDKVFDSLLALGLRPFVELNPMPAALASGEQTMFFYEMNVTPPARFEEWQALVEAFTRHCLERYGYEEVRHWYFEVWNEPNLKGFWSGSQEDYWQLYAHAARGVKAVHPELRIGGPATASGAWIGDLIHWCVDNDVPIDFVSTHLYPQDEYVVYPKRKDSPHEPGHFFADRVREVQQEVKASPRPDLEIHWTEWNTQSVHPEGRVTWGENTYVDSCFAASFLARNLTELDDACTSLGWWVISDIFEEGGIPNAPFSCTYGLMTIHGLPKASFHAFAFLAELRDLPRLPVDLQDAPDGCGACAVKTESGWKLLAWNHPPLETSDPADWTVKLTAGEPSVPGILFTSTIRPGAGSAWEGWQHLGRPHNLTPALEALLRSQAEPERTARTTDAGQSVSADLALAPYTVSLFEWTPAGQPAFGKGVPDDPKNDPLEDLLSGIADPNA
ncbi:MAG: GH39 family glycosyl hydrolase [Opitutales bacterium]